MHTYQNTTKIQNYHLIHYLQNKQIAHTQAHLFAEKAPAEEMGNGNLAVTGWGLIAYMNQPD